MSEEKQEMSNNFIHEMIEEDIAPGGQYAGQTVHTRFPPEPNGYLHIGHAKALYIDFATAEKYGGVCNLRMDDTNPVKEDERYVQALKDDIHWLGFDWGDRFYHASDYFEEMYGYACELIEKGLAFVCEMSPEEVREAHGTLTEPGRPSPWRDRPIEESLDLFARMRAGEFPAGKLTLRAKIDMSSGNMNMRDPVIYRISYEHHHRTGDKWCIYPMYDFAHPLEDAIEGITHSLCSLEFEDHRPLYNWVIENCSVPSKPRQIEFARLNLEQTMMSKRYLRQLVEEGLVDSWDDPRMPTLRGLRRRGYTPQAIRNFIERIGVSKVDSLVALDFLEYCLREDLDEHALRMMVVKDPIELIITNYPEDKRDKVSLSNHPKRPELGEHEHHFSKRVWIERDDFMVDAPRKYHRLTPGQEVRLRGAYVVKCTGYEETPEGLKVYAEYDPESFGGKTADGRKIRGTIHWVEAQSAKDVELRLYEPLFTSAKPQEELAAGTLEINPNSRQIIKGAKAEPALIEAVGKKPEAAFQFMRIGYFVADSVDYSPETPVFNQAVSLRSSYKPN
ncbi:MAG: glutamine--tRNA ligase/YqeY domain fusion protein [Eubacteriales bacterium]|nr:glutamine--tRNA ligase/YqeY domain fusion protein [Eubacteriales bacterium]